ncbi:hypothetical protein CAOG_003298 [Capsaspora owczarzaki ATCC 30864]|uniref:protein-tyrosine-phosphatase n=1 Tax=Capsaspora owczarzaki (strain ATCC 30864) TaxID=595528 RepID=A0A0D2VPC0_CAPO3|nr:hypothetical protein CAOG_003298 [Capsaspora owczarzaki ATCC 30864]
MSDSKGILFVCFGNICRSPMAEALCAHLLRASEQVEQTASASTQPHSRSLRWFVGSAATSDWNDGQQPDPRTFKICRHHGVFLSHVCRQVVEDDFDHYDFILAMDRENYKYLQTMKAGSSKGARLELLGDYDPKGVREILDPAMNKTLKMCISTYCDA